MVTTRVGLLALVTLLSSACRSPTPPSVFSVVTGTWAGRFEQTSCALPVDLRPCAFNQLGDVRLTLEQNGNEVEGRVEFWSDQSQSTQPLIGPLTVTGAFVAASLSLTGSAPIPTPAGNIDRALYDWETHLDPATGRMHGSTGWRVVSPGPPIAGASPVSIRTYTIRALRRVAW